MKNTLAIIALAIIGIITYAYAAYTRRTSPPDASCMAG